MPGDYKEVSYLHKAISSAVNNTPTWCLHVKQAAAELSTTGTQNNTTHITVETTKTAHGPKRPRPKRPINFRYDYNGPPLSLAFEAWLYF